MDTKTKRIIRVLRMAHRGDIGPGDARRILDRMDVTGPVEFQAGESCLALYDIEAAEWHVIERREVAA